MNGPWWQGHSLHLHTIKQAIARNSQPLSICFVHFHTKVEMKMGTQIPEGPNPKNLDVVQDFDPYQIQEQVDVHGVHNTLGTS